ncbi:hypothetical protein [Archangium lansingense]|uniref:Uncharacterized protein n=1 Tax=Archangium lansingense TaxID=2995310 RepID=A0ABT4AB30_9BACT|nr:hypothetical protein [Archangium lansinium]MCY1078869.1 hypothetical protein [Archangium lansinium]
MKPATVVLVEAKAGMWQAIMKDGREYIRDPNSTAAFPPLAGWPSAEAAHADLTRWGYLVLLPPEPHYIEIKA